MSPSRTTVVLLLEGKSACVPACQPAYPNASTQVLCLPDSPLASSTGDGVTSEMGSFIRPWWRIATADWLRAGNPADPGAGVKSYEDRGKSREIIHSYWCITILCWDRQLLSNLTVRGKINREQRQKRRVGRRGKRNKKQTEGIKEPRRKSRSKPSNTGNFQLPYCMLLIPHLSTIRRVAMAHQFTRKRVINDRLLYHRG